MEDHEVGAMVLGDAGEQAVSADPGACTSSKCDFHWEEMGWQSLCRGGGGGNWGLGWLVFCYWRE